MSDFQSDINSVIDEFVAKISSLARQAAINSLEQALGGRSLRAGTGRRGHKRSRDALETLSESFVAFVARHPGLRIEQINAKLQTTTKELAGPVRKLVADGVLKTKGQKRSRTYFAA